MNDDDVDRIDFSVSDPAELSSLENWLDWVSGIKVVRNSGRPGAGELGAMDSLTVIAGSGNSLVAALKVIPEFLRSRKPDLSVTVTVRGQDFPLDVANVDSTLPILENMLDE
jgi:hypothetical protein